MQPYKKFQGEKSCEIQVATKKWLYISLLINEISSINRFHHGSLQWMPPINRGLSSIEMYDGIDWQQNFNNNSSGEFGTDSSEAGMSQH